MRWEKSWGISLLLLTPNASIMVGVDSFLCHPIGALVTAGGVCHDIIEYYTIL